LIHRKVWGYAVIFLLPLACNHLNIIEIPARIHSIQLKKTSPGDTGIFPLLWTWRKSAFESLHFQDDEVLVEQ
jgi:hypothetical protein